MDSYFRKHCCSIYLFIYFVIWNWRNVIIGTVKWHWLFGYRIQLFISFSTSWLPSSWLQTGSCPASKPCILFWMRRGRRSPQYIAVEGVKYYNQNLLQLSDVLERVINCHYNCSCSSPRKSNKKTLQDGANKWQCKVDFRFCGNVGLARKSYIPNACSS